MIIRFLAVVLTGLAVVAPAAHLFELPKKIRMSEDDYLVVQKIYVGWWVVGSFLPAALIANAALAIAARDTPHALWFAAIAAALIILNLIIFMIWTWKVNNITDNWLRRTPDWEKLRREWEYSHATNALVTFLAFCFATLAALS